MLLRPRGSEPLRGQHSPTHSASSFRRQGVRDMRVLIWLYLLAAALAFGGAEAVPARAQTNLLTNGSFENGPIGLGLTALPGWEVAAGTVDVIGESSADPYIQQAPGQGHQSLELAGT